MLVKVKNHIQLALTWQLKYKRNRWEYEGTTKHKRQWSLRITFGEGGRQSHGCLKYLSNKSFYDTDYTLYLIVQHGSSLVS